MSETSKPTKRDRSHEDTLQFCLTMETRAWEHGFDVICRPRADAPRYEWRLGCGHTTVIGIATLNRHPEGLAWCNECSDYRVGFDCERVESGL